MVKLHLGEAPFMERHHVPGGFIPGRAVRGAAFAGKEQLTLMLTAGEGKVSIRQHRVHYANIRREPQAACDFVAVAAAVDHPGAARVEMTFFDA